YQFLLAQIFIRVLSVFHPWLFVFLEKMQAEEVERQFGRAALDFRPSTKPIVSSADDTAFPRQACVHKSHWLLRSAATRTRQADRAHAEIRAQAPSATDRHRLHDRRADDSVFLNQALRHVKQFAFDPS